MNYIKNMKGGSVKMDKATFATLKQSLVELGKSRVKVGILGPKSPRMDAGTFHNPEALNNAEIGLRNEFGVISERIPERSFLRMPMMTHLPKVLSGSGTKVWMDALIKKGPKFVLGSLGVAAEHSVQEAFATKGFGKWKPNAALTVILKGSARPLIDHGELRQAISSQVVTAKP